MKRIGLRTIKTAISIFLCLAVYIALKAVELIPGVQAGFAYSWYNPFFAGIATAYSVHSSKEASIAQAKNRCVASFIGGGIGILLITIYELCGGSWINLMAVDLQSLNFLLPYILISICSVLVVVTGLLLHQSPAIFVAILTFLSVTVNPNIQVGQWQWQFGINRILSTIIGVLVALGVNLFRLPHWNTNRNLLFCVGIDGLLQKDSDRFKGFMQYKLNYLHRIKANVTLFTTRTPTTFMPLLNDVKINHPVVCMSGAALYDTQNKKYLAFENMNEKTVQGVRKILSSWEISIFENRIWEDVLYTYYESSTNEAASKYILEKRNQGYGSFIPSRAPKGELLYFLIIEKEEMIKNIVEKLESSSLKEEIVTFVFDDLDVDLEGFKYLKIYSRKILALQSLKEYCLNKDLRIVGLSSSNLSNHLLTNSEIGITLNSLNEETKSYADKVLNTASPDALFKEANKIYYNNLAKYGKK